MTRAELIAELRGIETGGSQHCNDPEVWGCVHGAWLAVQRIQKERQEALAQERPALPVNRDSDGW